MSMKHMCVISFFLFLCGAFRLLHAAESMYIYYPSVLKPNVVQQKIKDLDNTVDVTVFGKYRDFQTMVALNKPDVVLTKSEILPKLSGYQSKKYARRQGNKKEQYVLLSVDGQNLTEESVVGVVDFLPRNDMRAFVASTIGKHVKVKNVTKVEDLLPLLSFKMAQAILIPAHNVAYFKEISHMTFSTIKLPTGGGIAVIAAKVGSESGNAINVAETLTEILPNFMGTVEWSF